MSSGIFMESRCLRLCNNMNIWLFAEKIGTYRWIKCLWNICSSSWNFCAVFKSQMPGNLWDHPNTYLIKKPTFMHYVGYRSTVGNYVLWSRSRRRKSNRINLLCCHVVCCMLHWPTTCTLHSRKKKIKPCVFTIKASFAWLISRRKCHCLTGWALTYSTKLHNLCVIKMACKYKGAYTVPTKWSGAHLCKFSLAKPSMIKNLNKKHMNSPRHLATFSGQCMTYDTLCEAMYDNDPLWGFQRETSSSPHKHHLLHM